MLGPRAREELAMKRKRRISGALALAIAGVIVSSGHASSRQATVTIRYQVRGGHAWSFDNGVYKASLGIRLTRSTALRVIDNDMMPHKLVQLAGPKATLISPVMNHMAAQAKVIFAARGIYRFTTKPGEDYMKMKTTGPTNVLRLTVTVS
jgi:hypothetical protein